jgi:hypothetical protein
MEHSLLSERLVASQIILCCTEVSYGLFNSIIDQTIHRQMVGRLMNRKPWRKCRWGLFLDIVSAFAWKNKENFENLNQDSGSPYRDSNRAPPEYKSDSLRPELHCSLEFIFFQLSSWLLAVIESNFLRSRYSVLRYTNKYTINIYLSLSDAEIFQEGRQDPAAWIAYTLLQLWHQVSGLVSLEY